MIRYLILILIVYYTIESWVLASFFGYGSKIAKKNLIKQKNI